MLVRIRDTHYANNFSDCNRLSSSRGIYCDAQRTVSTGSTQLRRLLQPRSEYNNEETLSRGTKTLGVTTNYPAEAARVRVLPSFVPLSLSHSLHLSRSRVSGEKKHRAVTTFTMYTRSTGGGFCTRPFLCSVCASKVRNGLLTRVRYREYVERDGFSSN